MGMGYSHVVWMGGGAKSQSPYPLLRVIFGGKKGNTFGDFLEKPVHLKNIGPLQRDVSLWILLLNMGPILRDFFVKKSDLLEQHSDIIFNYLDHKNVKCILPASDKRA